MSDFAHPEGTQRFLGTCRLFAVRRGVCENTRMKKDQLYIRLGPDATERIIRRFDDREMSAAAVSDTAGN